MSLSIAKSIRIKFWWETVTDFSKSDWPFSPDAMLSKALRQKIAGPRIYRFYFGDEEKPRCYIAESEKFEVRCSKYIRVLFRMRQRETSDTTLEDLLSALKRSNSDSCVRIAAHIINSELNKRPMELQLFQFEEFNFNKAVLSDENLTNPFVRRAIENLAVLDADTSGIRVLNRGRNIEAKKLQRLLAASKKLKQR